MCSRAALRRHALAVTACLFAATTLLAQDAPPLPPEGRPDDPSARLAAALDAAGQAATELDDDRSRATARAGALQAEVDRLRAATQPAPVPSPHPSTIPTTAPAPAVADVYVSPAGDDAAPGTAARPVRTISAAARLVRPGQVVLIAPGVYREAVLLSRGGEPGRPVTFRAARPGTVVIDGADPITNWRREPGDGAPVWSIAWAHAFDVGKLPDGSPKRYFGMLPPEGFCEQLFQDGRSLRRVMGPDAVPGVAGRNNASPGKGPGTFWIDYGAKRLYACTFDGADPNGVAMLAPVRDRLFMSKLGKGGAMAAEHVTVQNLTLRHACNFPQRGALTAGTGWRVEDVTVERVAAVGVWARGENVILLRVTAQDNGQAGIGGSSLTNSLVKDCASRRNNTRKFAVAWEGGGGKFSRTNHVRFEGHVAEENFGPGLWLDFKNANFTIAGGTFRGNRPVSADANEAAGVAIEISEGPGVIERCTFDRNVGPGVAIWESANVTVRDNAFAGTGVLFRDGPRTEQALKDATVTGNRFAARTGPALIALSGRWGPTAAADKGLTIDRNTYDPSMSSVAMWAGKRYVTVDDARAGLGIEQTKPAAP